MIDLKKSQGQGDSSIELDLMDQIKEQFSEKMNFHSVTVAVLKIIMLLIAPVMLKMHEVYNKNKLHSQLEQIQSELTAKRGELSKIDKEIAVYEGLDKKAREFDRKFKILEELAQDRLIVIKMLDSIQTGASMHREENLNTEEQAGVEIQKFIFFDNINVTGNGFNIRGVASSNEIISEFIIYLQSEELYSSVQLDSNDKRDAFRAFNIRGVVKKGV